ncbi:MAG: aminotransferase class I/II-fold pyridoxal phosphate-dependent enzyme [Anaerolineae bacterium]|nr:aminotransferase class I/II-fold pyridoxal phosphate-dependent enzyme [Anaerolineae bacterium]
MVSGQDKTLTSERIYLSPPHMGGTELERVQLAFADNWIAPAGPDLALFEQDVCDYIHASNAVAVSSGTAALHLALLAENIGRDDEVIVSSLTFIGTVNPILYVGARPVFIDSDAHSWNLDPNLLEDTLRKWSKSGRKMPKAVIVVHLYGQSADMDAIMAICDRYGVIVQEDAAEALGTYYKGRHAGTIGRAGVFSFNGNKIITTSGGGMLVSEDEEIINHARKLATQAREPEAHYEHTIIGYNYRMSNILAAIGRGQLTVLEERVARKRQIYDTYKNALNDIPGISFVDEMPYGRHTRWLSVMLIDEHEFGASPEDMRLALEEHNIESRPIWKPMHMQPVFSDCEMIGGKVSEDLFTRGLCLPLGTAMSDAQLAYIIDVIHEVAAQ